MTARPRLAGPAALGLCLLVIALLTAITPADDEIRKRYLDVVVGESATNRQFEATVTRVEIGQELIKNDYEPTVRSTAVFVVVSLTGRTPEQSALYNAIDLQTKDGRTYEARGEFSLSGPKATEPGFQTDGSVVFEVPPERVEDAKLIIAPDVASFEFYASVIRVDLALTDDTPYAAEPIVLPEATSEVIR